MIDIREVIVPEAKGSIGELLLLINFSHRKDSISEHESNSSDPLNSSLLGIKPIPVQRNKVAGVNYSYTYTRLGLKFLEMQTTDRDWIVDATSIHQTKEILYESAALAIETLRKPQLMAWLLG